MNDEIQLLNEVKQTQSDSDGESEIKKAKLHMKLDEVSLAKSIEDLRRLTSEQRNSFISPDANILQGLEHREVQMKSGDEKIVEVKISQRPMSNVSVEIGDYQSAIEDVLEKLLKAEDEVRVSLIFNELSKIVVSHRDYRFAVIQTHLIPQKPL